MDDRKGDEGARFYVDESTLTQHSLDFTDGSFIQYGYVWIFDREDGSVFSEMGDYRVSWVRADVAPFHCAALNAHDEREKYAEVGRFNESIAAEFGKEST